MKKKIVDYIIRARRVNTAADRAKAVVAIVDYALEYRDKSLSFQRWEPIQNVLQNDGEDWQDWLNRIEKARRERRKPPLVSLADVVIRNMENIFLIYDSLTVYMSRQTSASRDDLIACRDHLMSEMARPLSLYRDYVPGLDGLINATELAEYSADDYRLDEPRFYADECGNVVRTCSGAAVEYFEHLACDDYWGSYDGLGWKYVAPETAAALMCKYGGSFFTDAELDALT